MKRILVLGMYEDAMYHPMAGVDDFLKKYLPQFEFVFTDDVWELCNVSGYDGFISYWDDWNNKIPDAASEALQDYVLQGGKMLVLHNGISLQLQEKLKVMMGGKFLTHPAQEEIVFKLKPCALTEGCADFTLMEEPYQFALEEDDKNIFMTYSYRGEIYPAGWQKTFGKGEIIFLTPGHTPEKFEDATYTQLIQNCAHYLF
ncbi:MAG: ThuA domain-containing protein [Lachnospiraceae bacterium]|nr:ThuA domain-containing protein [Lachnospiraceae bacterium]